MFGFLPINRLVGLKWTHPHFDRVKTHWTGFGYPLSPLAALHFSEKGRIAAGSASCITFTSTFFSQVVPLNWLSKKSGTTKAYLFLISYIYMPKRVKAHLIHK
jgi:hypothetical protein